MGLTISAPKWLGFVDLDTKGLFSMFSGLVCLLIRFLFFLGWFVFDGIFSVVGLCFLGWSVSVFWVDVLGFFLFWLVCLCFLGCYSGFLHWFVFSFLGCCIL